MPDVFEQFGADFAQRREVECGIAFADRAVVLVEGCIEKITAGAFHPAMRADARGGEPDLGLGYCSKNNARPAMGIRFDGVASRCCEYAGSLYLPYSK